MIKTRVQLMAPKGGVCVQVIATCGSAACTSGINSEVVQTMKARDLARWAKLYGWRIENGLWLCPEHQTRPATPKEDDELVDDIVRSSTERVGSEVKRARDRVRTARAVEKLVVPIGDEP